MSIWWWRLSHRRCEAWATNGAGDSLMDNPLSVYRAPLSHGERCRNPVVASLKGKRGQGVINICEAHAKLLQEDSLALDVNRQLLKRQPA